MVSPLFLGSIIEIERIKESERSGEENEVNRERKVKK
jgi:hypothetical protein